MAQKYKVFIESNYIIFTDVDLGLPNWKGAAPRSFLELSLSFQNEASYQVLFSNPKDQMHSFFAAFKKINTAGGLVEEPQMHTFLWISRFGFLDLPKGKIEKGEETLLAAIREIQEETGLTGRFLPVRSLQNTYHVYSFNKRSIFKENNWFHFKYEGPLEVRPQSEEGINAVYWLDEAQWRQRLHETYPGLQEMLSDCF